VYLWPTTITYNCTCLVKDGMWVVGCILTFFAIDFSICSRRKKRRRYVGGYYLWSLYPPKKLVLYLHKETCVAFANIRWSINENRIEIDTYPNLVMAVKSQVCGFLKSNTQVLPTHSSTLCSTLSVEWLIKLDILQWLSDMCLYGVCYLILGNPSNLGVWST
jgi:hypothetical protein